MTKVLFPFILGILTVLQLYSCLRGQTTLRMFTKVLLMPVLGVCWIIFAEAPSPLVLAGILLGGFGDLALLWPLKKGPFLLGVLSFFLGHVCYLSYIFTAFEIHAGIFWPIFIALIYLAGSSFVYISTRKEIPTILRVPSFLYMLALSSLSACTLLVLISNPGWGKAVAFAGATLFLMSDGVLSQMLFVKKEETPILNFIVMLTYIFAQCLLAAGWIIG